MSLTKNQLIIFVGASAVAVALMRLDERTAIKIMAGVLVLGL